MRMGKELHFDAQSHDCIKARQRNDNHSDRCDQSSRKILKTDGAHRSNVTGWVQAYVVNALLERGVVS